MLWCVWEGIDTRSTPPLGEGYDPPGSTGAQRREAESFCSTDRLAIAGSPCGRQPGQGWPHVANWEMGVAQATGDDVSAAGDGLKN